MRGIKELLAMTLILALATSSLPAQTADEAKQLAKVHVKLERIFNNGSRARLDMKDGRKIQGVITELDADTFVLASAGHSESYSYAEIKKVGRIGPSPDARKWVALGVLGGLFGFIFWAAATQTR